MYYDDDTGTMSFLTGVLVGALLGAGIALLSAPQPGRKTRRRLKKAVSNARDTAGHRWGDLSDEVRSAVETGRKRVRL